MSTIATVLFIVLAVLFAAGGVPVLGVAAAIGLVLLMIGAIAYHVRASDWAGAGPPALRCIVAAAAAVIAWPAVGS